MGEHVIPEDATHVRASHPYSFRSGRWARIIARDTSLADGRPTVLVEFPDGVTDTWVIDDETAGWEFGSGGECAPDPTACTCWCHKPFGMAVSHLVACCDGPPYRLFGGSK